MCLLFPWTASPPELEYKFISQTLTPGPSVSLKCIASGTPTPTISWALDGFPLPQNERWVHGSTHSVFIIRLLRIVLSVICEKFVSVLLYTITRFYSLHYFYSYCALFKPSFTFIHLLYAVSSSFHALVISLPYTSFFHLLNSSLSPYNSFLSSSYALYCCRPCILISLSHTVC